jgi:hypothetical protein
MDRKSIIITILLASILLVWGFFLINRHNNKGYKYVIHANGHGYRTNSYEIRPDGCVSFDNGIICGTYVIENQ